MKEAPKTNHKNSSLKLKKGLWSPDEDHRLFSFVMQNGITCWSTVPQHAGLRRCGKSCRLRWINYLRPDLKRGSFSAEEENLIIDLHSRLGNRWSQIAARLPGRTDNDIKNFWNTHIKKKIAQTKIEGAGDSPSLYSLEKLQRLVTGLKQEPDYDQQKMFMDCNWNELVLRNHFPPHTTSLMSLTVKGNNNSALLPDQSTPPVALDDGSTACFIDEVLSDQRTWNNDEMNDSTGSKTERISKAIHGGVNVSSMYGNEAMIIASEQQHFWQDLREPEDSSDEKLCFQGKEGNALECYSSWICEMQDAGERLFTELVGTRVEPLSGLHVD